MDFAFPSVTEVTNTKDSLVRMMEAFETIHGDQGLLFVLDELLDYLRTRRDAELIQDLAFLREIGEICRSTRFRFIAGIQEAIFDNPRFAGAADAVSRVRDRFTQMRISRDDIAYVVQERLLRKSPEQKAKIRDHLQPFTPAYEGMAENLESFVSLFPVHPAYLKTFELITLVEKRKVLTTLSEEIRAVLERDVPAEAPGLICYDTYSAQLGADPSNRAIPEVREVLDRAQVLRNRVERALPTTSYIPTALRIVDALSVHRLTTEDIAAPIGPTIAELRDDLTLLPPGIPELDAFFLETSIGSIVDDIVRAVSGQFITVNDENGQVYLDVRKNIDYDQKIDERAESLDANKLDEAYFRALETVLEQRDNPYVAGYRIWAYELSWASKNVTRLGYLFMGAPNERSTAQPARDFYIYFLQPYDRPRFDDEVKSDEVFFRLATPDEAFTGALRRYAGAVALEMESTGQHRTIYTEKRQRYLREMAAWLRKHMGDAVTVTYRGEAKPLASWLASAQGPRASLKEQIDTIAASVLAPHFNARYPGYPSFGVPITRANRGENVKQALIQIVTGRQSATGGKVLAALNLVDVQGNLIDSSPFAVRLLEQVDQGSGRAVNRGELFAERDAGVPTWGPWHLEIGWFVVVAATLTQLGRVELGFSNGQLDALGLDKLMRVGLEDLEAVTHVAPPKELPIVILRDALQLLGLRPGAVGQQGASEALVQQVGTRCEEYSARMVTARAVIADGLNVWGAQVVEHQAERAAALTALDDVVNNLKSRNTVGKLNKLALTKDQIEKASDGKSVLAWLESSCAAAAHVSDVVAYLREAVEVFGPADPISIDASNLRNDLLEVFRSLDAPDAGKMAALKAVGEHLRRQAGESAAAAHERDRLDGAGDERKRRLLEGAAYADLTRLSSIDLLAGGKFASLQQRLADVRTCKTFDPAALQRSVICPECNYRPRAGSGPSALASLEQLEDQITTLRIEWERVLADSLAVPKMAEQIQLLLDDEQATVKEFVSSQRLAEPVTDYFVKAVREVLARFVVRKVAPGDVWSKLFPEAASATLAELSKRFGSMLEELADGKPPDRVRVVPVEDAKETAS